MAFYTPREYYHMLLALGEAGGKAGAAVNIYRQRWRNADRFPDANVFRTLERHCLETNALMPRGNPDVGRPANRRNVVLQDRILDCVAEQPTRSTRSLARQFGTSHSAVWKTLNEDGQHLHHYAPIHKLQARDPAQRLAFCGEFIKCAENDPTYVDRVLWTDVAMCTKEGIFNQHNSHYWDHKNPNTGRVNSFEDGFSFNVWAGIVGDELIGPVMFPDRLDASAYLEFLEKDLPDLIAHLPLELLNQMIYQHDGTPAHFSLVVRDYLDREWPDRWIGKRGPVLWPPRSPDLTPLHYFLWRHMETKVYRGQVVDDKDELIRRVHEAAALIPDSMIRRATRSVLDRARMCIEKGGQHIE